MNWIGIMFSFGIPLGVVVCMTVILIKEHIEKKRRDKRCHQRIRNWWEMEVE